MNFLLVPLHRLLSQNTLQNTENFAEPLEGAHGTLGFRGTPVEKHWYKC
jgi:hypothetical protein